MIPPQDIRFEVSVSDKKPMCWLCQDTIDEPYATVDIKGHIYDYRSHFDCLFQFFGVFTQFVPMLPKEPVEAISYAA